MRILHFYLIRRVLTTLGMSVAVFTFILLLANVLQSVLSLLVNRQAGLLAAIEAILLLIPYVLVYALPIGMLTAMLLVFGRFSADNELIAARANGISLASLSMPLLILSALLCALCGYINLEAAPKCRVAFKKLLFETGRQQLTSMIQEGVFITHVPNVIFYAGGVKGNQLEDVMFFQFSGDRKQSDVRAPRASYYFTNSNRLVFEFYDADILKEKSSLTQPAPDSGADFQYAYTHVGSIQHTITLPEEASYRGPKTSEMSLAQLREEKRDLLALGMEPQDVLLIDIQIHSKLSFSFASFGFTLIGIPLGIRTHRRETSVGMALAIVLMLVYNSFFILGQGWDNYPELYPQIVVWLPNFLFQFLGGFLLWRANRGIG